MRGIVFCVTLSLILCYYSVNGSGYFLKPLSRSSLWRFTGGLSYASQIKVNRDDLNLNCGGVHTMGGDLTGKCGACGDPVNGPKQNEAGGLYASGHPTAVYNEGSIINVTVFVQNRKNGGFFEFYLCQSDVTTAVSEVCFQNHPLKLANSQETSIPIKDVDGEITVPLQLPSALTCDHCVMRWVWVTDSEWKCIVDSNGQYMCGQGLSTQPTFVNCADVKIVKSSSFPTFFEWPNYQPLYAGLDGNISTTTEKPPTTPERLVVPVIPIFPNPFLPVVPATGTGTVGGATGAGTGTAATGTGATGTVGTAGGIGTANGTGLFGFGNGILSSWLPLLALLLLIGMGAGRGRDPDPILIEEVPTAQNWNQNWSQNWPPKPPNWSPRSQTGLGQPFFIPSQQTQISVSATVDSGGYQGKSTGYNQPRGYSNYSG